MFDLNQSVFAWLATCTLLQNHPATHYTSDVYLRSGYKRRPTKSCFNTRDWSYIDTSLPDYEITMELKSYISTVFTFVNFDDDRFPFDKFQALIPRYAENTDHYKAIRSVSASFRLLYHTLLPAEAKRGI